MTQSHFQPLGVQSHYFLSWVFRIVGLHISHWHSYPQFSFIGVQSHLFQFQVFRPIHFISFRHSKPLISSSFRCPEPLSLHSLAFKAIIICFQFYAFKAMYSIWHLEPSYFPVLGVQSHSFHQFQAFRATNLFQFQAFRATISPQFGVQSHHHMSSVLSVQSHIFNLAFRAIIFFSLAFRVIVHPHLGIQSHHLSLFWHSELQLLAFIFISIAHLALTILHSFSVSSPRYLVLIACSSCFSRGFELIACVLILSLQHMTQSSIVYVWFFHLYSFLCSLVVQLLLGFDIDFRVTFGDFSGVLDPQCNFRGTLGVSVHAISFL